MEASRSGEPLPVMTLDAMRSCLVPRARSFLGTALPLLFLTWMSARVTADARRG